MRISDWSSDVCSSDLKFSEPARQAIDGLAPTNVACPDRLAREKPTVEPDTKVRPLLERGVPRSFHCPAKRKRCSMCIEQRSEERRGGKECVSACRYRWREYN